MIKRSMPWGKYLGEDLRTIPRQYLGWVLKKCEWIDDDLASDIRAAIKGEDYKPTQEERLIEIFNNGEQNENMRSEPIQSDRPFIPA